MTQQDDNLRTTAHLIETEIKAAYLKWGKQQPLRTGAPHASALLSPDNEWCVRRYVLAQLQPDEAQSPELKYWDWKQKAIFLQGWEIHRMIQLIFKDHMQVVYTNGEPELDRTHYDEVRNVYFSPDIIFDSASWRYVGEIKGIKQEAYRELTDDLTQAMSVNETIAKAVPQANLYMHLLGLKRAVILAVNKNDSREFKVWVTEHDTLKARPYTHRAYDVKGGVTLAREKGKYPARVCSSPDVPLARKCPMSKICFSEKMETK